MEVEVNNKLELDTMQIINDIVEDIIQPVLESNSKESFLKSSELSAEYKFKSFPLITKDSKSYKFQHNKEQYLKGCKWSPDGTCLLTSCVDKKLRIYDTPKECFSTKSWNSNSQLPEISTSLKVQEGGLVYDFDWFPLMSSWDPISCCFLTTASEEPVHLWDAFTGELRASYRSYNYADEIWNAYSVTFNSSGERLYCGFKDSIRIFDTAIPGKKSTLIKIKEVTGQLGIVSCIAFNPSSTDYAVGTYAKEIGVYSEKSGTGTCVFQGHGGGITHLIFSPDGNRLYSGSRRDSEIVCWDVRNPGAVLFSMLRSVNTQQRIYFDLTPDGSSLVTGNTDGRVCIFDVTGAVSNPDTPFETQLYFNAHKDCCNGVSINPVCPVLATTSGQRHIPQVMSDSDDSEDDFQPVGDEGDIFVKDSTKTNIKKLFNYNYLKRNIEDCVKLWWVGDTVITGTDV